LVGIFVIVAVCLFYSAVSSTASRSVEKKCWTDWSSNWFNVIRHWELICYWGQWCRRDYSR